MHNRIRDLAVEAGIISSEYNGFDATGLTLAQRKFADLIVQDCIRVVNRRYMGDNNREDMEVRRCVEDLKKQFGVE